jgi:ketosteroid isomerase-like protein
VRRGQAWPEPKTGGHARDRITETGARSAFFSVSHEALDIVLQSAERWNAGDFEGMFELYADDVVVVTGEHWPEANVTTEGKDAFRESTRDWLSVWEQVQLETDHVEAHGDRVVARGQWRSTGRMSGVEGMMPIHIVLTVRDGRIARVEWYPDHERAVAAARGA